MSPAEGMGAAIVMPRCTTGAMSPHLAEISAMTGADAHAALRLDQAGRRVAKDLAFAGLSNRIVLSGNAILDNGCAAGNRLISPPSSLISVGLRDWAHEF